MALTVNTVNYDNTFDTTIVLLNNPDGASFPAGQYLTVNNVSYEIQSSNGNSVTVYGNFIASQGDVVTVDPGVVDKKFVQQNAGALGGSFVDLRAETGTFTGQVIVSGGLDVAGNKIVNVAAGTDTTDAVNYGQLTSYVAAEISAAAVDEDSRLTALEGRASTLEGDVADLDAALSSEISRSTEADNSLELRLSLEEDARSAEASRATEAEASIYSALSSALDNEASVRAEADASLSSALSSEADAARSAEASLSTLISNEVTDREAAVSSALSSANSYTDQKVADLVDSAPQLLDTLNELAAALGDDPNFATTILSTIASSEAAMEAAISTETSTRIDSINSVELAFAAADSLLQDAIDAEASYRADADASLSALISQEQSRAEDAEASIYVALSSGLSSEASRAAEAEASLAAEFSTEISSAMSQAAEDFVNVSGDTMTGNLTVSGAEIRVQPSNQQSTDYVNVSENEIEVINASGQLALATNITPGVITLTQDGEAKYAVNAYEVPVYAQLTDLSSAVSSALSSEASDRAAADLSLENRISLEEDARISNVDSLESALSTEVVERSAAVSSEASLRSEADQSIMTEMENADASLSSLVSSEASRAEGVEASLENRLSLAEDAIADEASRAEGVEASLENRLSLEEDALANEISRATSAEGSLASDLADEVNRAELAEQSIINRFDAQLAGLTWKNSVKVMITGSSPTTAGLYTVDGYEILAGDRVLVNADVLDASGNYVAGGAAENGIYVAATGSWARAEDMNDLTPFNEVNSAAVFVEEGSVFADTAWTQVLAVNDLGTDPLKFVQFNGAAGTVAGAGLTKTGNTLDIGSDYTITVGADEIGVSVSYTQERDDYADQAVSTLSTSVSSALSSEVADRISDVQSLESALSTETEDRISDVQSLESALSIEVSDRADADSSLSSLVSSEASRAEGAEASLETRISNTEDALTDEVSRAEGVEASLEARISAEEVATDSRLDEIENNYLDKRVGGVISSTASLALADGNNGYAIAVDAAALTINVPATVNNNLTVAAGTFTVNDGQNAVFTVDQVITADVMVSASMGLEVDTTGGGVLRVADTSTGDNWFEVSSALAGVNVPMSVANSLVIGPEQIELAPVVAKLTTIGTGSTATTGVMFSDLANFTGMVMANFQVVAVDDAGVGNGIAGEYRVSGFCDAGALTVSSLVVLEEVNIGAAALDVQILSTGTIQVSNGPNDSGTFRWHVQRVKMVAVDASGNVL